MRPSDERAQRAHKSRKFRAQKRSHLYGASWRSDRENDILTVTLRTLRHRRGAPIVTRLCVCTCFVLHFCRRCAPPPPHPIQTSYNRIIQIPAGGILPAAHFHAHVKVRCHAKTFAPRAKCVLSTFFGRTGGDGRRGRRLDANYMRLRWRCRCCFCVRDTFDAVRDFASIRWLERAFGRRNGDGCFGVRGVGASAAAVADVVVVALQGTCARAKIIERKTCACGWVPPNHGQCMRACYIEALCFVWSLLNSAQNLLKYSYIVAGAAVAAAANAIRHSSWASALEAKPMSNDMWTHTLNRLRALRSVCEQLNMESPHTHTHRS